MSEIVGTNPKEDKLVQDFTKLETLLLEYSLDGMSIRKISVALKAPEQYVRAFFNKKKVKAWMLEQKELQAEMLQMKIQGLLEEVIEKRIDDAEGDVSKLTKKDTLDVLRLLHDISSGVTKQTSQSEADDKYTSILEKVMKDV